MMFSILVSNVNTRVTQRYGYTPRHTCFILSENTELLFLRVFFTLLNFYYQHVVNLGHYFCQGGSNKYGFGAGRLLAVSRTAQKPSS